MSRLQTALVRILGGLAAGGRRAALVGGLAVSARCEPRFTRDLDLAVAVADDSEAEEVIRRFLADGCRTLALVEQEGASRLAAVRLVLPGEDAGGVVADLLFASSGIEPEIVAAAEPIEVFPDLVVPVATAGHLIALKLLARDDRRRPQDAADLRALRIVATASEQKRARDAAHLIAARGFDRGRDLRALLEAFLSED